MTYSICERIGELDVFKVCCAACSNDLGTMTSEMIREALRFRGPVICPECRQRKCDFCGFLRVERTQVVGNNQDRICLPCHINKRHLAAPLFVLSMAGVRISLSSGRVMKSSPEGKLL